MCIFCKIPYDRVSRLIEDFNEKMRVEYSICFNLLGDLAAIEMIVPDHNLRVCPMSDVSWVTCHFPRSRRKIGGKRGSC